MKSSLFTSSGTTGRSSLKGIAMAGGGLRVEYITSHTRTHAHTRPTTRKDRLNIQFISVFILEERSDSATGLGDLAGSAGKVLSFILRREL